MRKQYQSRLFASVNRLHLSLYPERNQICVARETKLPAMTEQREPFCFIDCFSLKATSLNLKTDGEIPADGRPPRL